MDKKAQKLVMICSFSLRSAHLVIFSKKFGTKHSIRSPNNTLFQRIFV